MRKVSAFGTVTLNAATANYQVLPPNDKRSSVRIKNTGNNPVTLGPGADASNGYFLGAGDEVIFDDENSVPSDFIQASSIFGTTLSFWATVGKA